MKKSKRSEQTPADFRNNPFKSLKGFLPKQSQPSTKRSTTASPVAKNLNSGEHEDDGSLFFRAVDGAKRLGPVPDDATVELKPIVPEIKVTSAPEDDQLFFQAMKKIGATFREEIPDQEDDATERRSPSGRMRQLKRGTIHISHELDLHGLIKEEALVQWERFIAASFSRGLKAVLVITGKGTNSPGEPVLPGAVAAWMRTKGKGMVAEFGPAPRDKGGSGAYVVFLRNRNPA